MKEDNKFNKSIEEFVFEDTSEEFNGICDDISGIPISSFTFTNETSSKKASPKLVINTPSFSNINKLNNNPKIKSKVFQQPLPADGEPLDIQRSYKIRNSTARMLNEIKAVHPDVNVYMNTIVDAAIRNYYDYIFNRDGIKSL
jgi:hypothetical protein